MLANLLREYSDIVVSWSVTELDHDGPDFRLKARIVFRDQSVLHVRQMVIDEESWAALWPPLSEVLVSTVWLVIDGPNRSPQPDKTAAAQKNPVMQIKYARVRVNILNLLEMIFKYDSSYSIAAHSRLPLSVRWW